MLYRCQAVPSEHRSDSKCRELTDEFPRRPSHLPAAPSVSVPVGLRSLSPRTAKRKRDGAFPRKGQQCNAEITTGYTTGLPATLRSDWPPQA